MNAAHAHIARLERYYRLHASIYDATRWSFLFGRQRLIKSLPDLPPHPRILDVGCGTGKTTALLHGHYPSAQIIGMDLSDAMLKKARKKWGDVGRIRFVHDTYGLKSHTLESFDLIVFSYSLAMMGSEAELVIRQTCDHLTQNGIIAVVDFHDTPWRRFERWMNANHVTMNGSILAALKRTYAPTISSTHKAYGGLWAYFNFVGRLRV